MNIIMKSSLGNILLSSESYIPAKRMYTSELVFKIYYLTLPVRIITLVLQAPSARIGEAGDWEGMKKLSFI